MRDAPRWTDAGRGPRSAPIRVLVVDDSSFMRAAVVRMLQSESGIQVVGTGHNGADAVDLAGELRPDLITLDVEMPVMDGLEALAAIMRQHPTPVLMLSAHTRPGAVATLRALELGAADFLVKPDPRNATEVNRLRDDLVARVYAISCRHAGPRTAPPPTRTGPLPVLPGEGFRLVVIGASTGGPRALQHLVSELPHDLDAGVLIVQHMPRLFTSQFAARLNDGARVPVREAEHGARIEPGRVLLAPGGTHLELSRVRGHCGWVRLTNEPAAATYRPSVDVLFRSAARLNGPRTLGVVLTGMGDDGLEGMRELRAAGALTLAQDRESSVVYGMPRACAEAGVVDRVVGLQAMSGAILGCLGASGSRGARGAA